MQAAGKWQQAIGGYNALKGYRDSRERIAECEEGIRADAYRSATAFKDNRKWDEAISAFEKLGDYRDSLKQVGLCRDAKEAERRAEEARREQERREAEVKEKAEAAKRRARTIVAILLVALIAVGAFVYIRVIKPNGIYSNALKALEAGNYDEAISAFSSLGEYKDAAARTGQAQADQLFANGAYSEALTVYNALDAAYRTHAADYEQMYTDAAKMLIEGDYDGATAAFQSISGYNDADTQALESQYQKAAALNTAGKYDEAYTIYAALTGYKDVDSLIENDDNIAAAAWRAQFDAGNTVQFGRYEQDNNTSNGVEAIEWIVLANDGDTATLISKYALDARPYNTEGKSVTWETCTLRKWLNGDFLNTAFSAEEQARLETVTVTADKNPKYDTDPGNDTQDKVFLLSIDEVNTLFSGDEARRCQATAYAKAHGAYVSDSGNSWWWLRSPGYGTNYAAHVHYVGSVGNYGNRVNNESEVVRPVVVLRLS